MLARGCTDSVMAAIGTCKGSVHEPWEQATCDVFSNGKRSAWLPASRIGGEIYSGSPDDGDGDTEDGRNQLKLKEKIN